MKRYLFDSNTLNAFLEGLHGVRNRAQRMRVSGVCFGTSMSVLSETLGGIEYSRSRDGNMAKFQANIGFFRIWPFDMKAARRYGRLYAELRSSGITMQPLDMITAAVALELSHCTVVTTDSDFARVPGLSVENWLI